MACALAVTVEAPPSFPCCYSAVSDAESGRRCMVTVGAATGGDGGPLACAVRVLTKVERSLLRALAFILYRLNRDHARYCATSVLQWYLLLQSQLPGFAVESLEKAAASVSALADASFADFWLSLLSHEVDSDRRPGGGNTPKRPQPLSLESPAELGEEEEDEHQQQHLLARLYEYITRSILGFFMGHSSPSDAKQRRNLTPCTSPVGTTANPRLRHRRRRLSSADDEDEDYWSRRDWQDDEGVGSADEESDTLEPGWAVEYMEQELMLPTDMKRRMATMMHSSVPLNLFRATVAYPSTDDDTYGEEDDDDRSSSCASDRGRGFVGAITPGSLPPTPVTRDLQARRMHRYTVFVLDHTTHALRLLEAHCFE